MAELRKIGVVSVMKLFFVVYFLLGFLVGLGITLFSVVMSSALGNAAGNAIPGGMWLFGPLAVVVMPLLYGTIGALFSGLGALIYNLLAAYVGGVQVLILFPVKSENR
jgi:hypothetical protein